MEPAMLKPPDGVVRALSGRLGADDVARGGIEDLSYVDADCRLARGHAYPPSEVGELIDPEGIGAIHTALSVRRFHLSREPVP